MRRAFGARRDGDEKSPREVDSDEMQDWMRYWPSESEEDSQQEEEIWFTKETYQEKDKAVAKKDIPAIPTSSREKRRATTGEGEGAGVTAPSENDPPAKKTKKATPPAKKATASSAKTKDTKDTKDTLPRSALYPPSASITMCSACRSEESPFYIHPFLSVPICRECYLNYHRGEFTVEGDNEIYCRWCGDGGGGDGLCCDTCPKLFCLR